MKERQAKRKQARWRPAALEADEGQAARSRTGAGPGRAPAGQHQARERAMAVLQAKAKQPSAAGQQQEVSQVNKGTVLRCNKRGCLMADLHHSAVLAHIHMAFLL